MKWFIFDLDDTLVDCYGNLLIKDDVIHILKELYSDPEYKMAIASFNYHAKEILANHNIIQYFDYISAGIIKPDGKIHDYPMSKVDNILEITANCNITDKNKVVFLDNDPINCKHVRSYLGIASVVVSHITGLKRADLNWGLDMLSYVGPLEN